MRILRHVLLILALFVYFPAKADEKPPGGTSSFTLVLIDTNGLWGGRDLFITPDGIAYVCVVKPPEGKDNGLQERRYKIQLSPDDIQRLRKKLDQNHFLAMTIPKRDGIPDETYITISVKITGTQWRDVSKWESEKHPAFTAIYQHLLDIVHRAEKTKPFFKGNADQMWTPEGFVR